MTQGHRDSDQGPGPEPLPPEQEGQGRRTFGLGLFFLMASIGAMLIWWLVLFSPVSLDTLFGHYEGLEDLTDNVGFVFLVLAGLCFAFALILLIMAFLEGRKRRSDSQSGG